MRRLQLYLSLLGCLSALTGALLLLAASLPMLLRLQGDALPDHAVYVGSDVCFTCHAEQQSAWSNPLNPRLIDDQAVNPHAVAMSLPPVEVLPVGTDLSTRPLRAFDASAGDSFPTAYRFSDPYPAPPTLSSTGKAQLP